MKQKCAKKAFELIKDGMAIGLGGGATVALLIEELEQRNKKVTAVTPSTDTMELCCQRHIPVLPLEMVSHIDLAFDGCDELDMELNALKSCGGIHTREKIMAAMAKDYILLADETKLGERLKFHVPITIEAIPAAKAYVKTVLTNMGATVSERRGDKKAGLVISDDGNYLFDAVFPTSHKQPPETHKAADTKKERNIPYVDLETDPPQLWAQNVRRLSELLDHTPGIVGHSLFYKIASKAIIARKDRIDIIENR